MKSFQHGPAYFVLLASFVFTGNRASAQVGDKVKIYREFSEELVERVLKNKKINFRKEATTSGTPKHFYAFEVDGKHLSSVSIMKRGKVLWAMAIFKEVNLDVLNAWNKRTATSRAVLRRNSKTGKNFSVVEWQIDSGGGTTENLIRGFITRFESDVRGFADHVKNE